MAALVLFGVWVLFLLFERDNPEDVGLPGLVEEVEIEVSAERATQIESGEEPWKREVVLSIFFMGCCYFVFKFLRYALDSWSPLAIKELFALPETDAGYISTAFDWVGFLGVLFAGWASDRFFEGRRCPVIFGMTVGMLFAFTFLAFVGVNSVWMFALGLSLCGFMLMGPDSLLSGVGAVDVAGRGNAVVAAGIINGLGSIGPIFQEEIIGYMLDTQGYTPVFYMLIGISALGVIGTLYLARRSRQGLSSL